MQRRTPMCSWQTWDLQWMKSCKGITQQPDQCMHSKSRKFVVQWPQCHNLNTLVLRLIRVVRKWRDGYLKSYQSHTQFDHQNGKQWRLPVGVSFNVSTVAGNKVNQWKQPEAMRKTVSARELPFSSLDTQSCELSSSEGSEGKWRHAILSMCLMMSHMIRPWQITAGQWEMFQLRIFCSIFTEQYAIACLKKYVWPNPCWHIVD